MGGVSRRAFLVSGAAFLTAPLAAEAQQTGKVYRVGFLHWGTRGGFEHQFQAFEQALRERGWVTGENLVITYRFAEGQHDRLPALAGELVRLEPHVIVALPTAATRAAKDVTSTIPIVMMNVSDPIGERFKKCHALIEVGKHIENALKTPGQFNGRPQNIGHFVNEPFAAALIYPAVLAAWSFVALWYVLPQTASYAALLVFGSWFAGTLGYATWLRDRSVLGSDVTCLAQALRDLIEPFKIDPSKTTQPNS